MSEPATLDHLIVAANTLEQGAAFIAEKLGSALQPGGKHAAMGTHNLLLGLGARVYLEVIAIDPYANNPNQPRWFGLDDARMRQRLAQAPRLVTWAARTGDIQAAAASCPFSIGGIHPMTRGAYSWRITIPDDGALVCDGLMPALIQWDGDIHPADRLEDGNCSLAKLEATHPAPATLEIALTRLGLSSTLAVTRARRAELTATLRGPRGTFTLTS